MPYSTQSDLETRITAVNLARLCNDDLSNPTKADYGVVTALIARADAMIDAKVSQVYVVPLSTPIDVIIKSISIDLACYYAMQRKFSDLEMPKDWSAVYTDAMNNLNDIADEQLFLNSAQKIASPESAIVAPCEKFNSHGRILENY